MLMWWLRRHVVAASLPPGRTVLHFRREEAPRQQRYWWIAVQRGEELEDVDVCMTEPGHPVTLTITARPRTLVDLLMEDAELAEVLRWGLVVEGERELVRRVETLFEFEPSGPYAGARRTTPVGGRS